MRSSTADRLHRAARALPLRGFLAVVLVALPTLGQQGFSLDTLRARARELAKSAYVERTESDLPAKLAQLDYDGYRRVRFRPEVTLWAGETLPFCAQFLHRGYLFRQKTPIWSIDGAAVRELRFDPAQFEYDPTLAQGVPADLGYSGFALRTRRGRPGLGDEFVTFQGASYFRLLARGQIYGASARGLAIDTAAPKGEEFPAFVEFWLEKPAETAARQTVYALLDSPSTTGAYRFVVEPGDQTKADVSAFIYPRRAIEKLGLAPLTTMFLLGEGRATQIHDWRPEVHDSDGLSIAQSDGTWLWRPLENPERAHRVTRFVLENPAGFGLLQRDRAFTSYEDLEARFETRPSFWVAPRGTWGKGAIELVEIPTSAESNENIVAYWVPEKPAAGGDEIHFEYQLSAYTDDASRPPLARARSTRVRAGKDASLFVLDFGGAELEHAPADLRADIAPSRGQVKNAVLQRNEPAGGERCSFEWVDSAVEPVEIRVTLRSGDRALSETLVLQWARP